jgi:hypothetical protein
MATWWATCRPGGGNINNEHPRPVEVPYAPGAADMMRDIRKREKKFYDAAATANDEAAMAVWSRAGEKARRLALIHACSKDHLNPQITPEAVEWAWQLVEHQTKRMLHMVFMYVSDSDFENRCKRVVEMLTKWKEKNGDQWMLYREISRKYRWTRREHEEVRKALLDQELIEVDFKTTAGRPRMLYRLG